MKLDFCILCGKKIKSGKGVGPVCGSDVGAGPNTHRHSFAKIQFSKTIISARGMGIVTSHDAKIGEIFCLNVNHPNPSSMDQELKIRALKKYFYQMVYYSLSGQEQRELMQRLYEDKDSSV